MPKKIQALLADLHDSRKEIRAEAARQLGQVGKPALPGLLLELQNPEWVVRYRVIEALTTIADPCVDGVLIKALHDQRDHVRYMAAKGLGARMVQTAIPSLIHCLNDENEFVRMIVARSLAALGNHKAIPALRDRLEKETISRVAEELKKALDRLENGYV
jgi:HEAT repeat protein